MRVLWCFTGAGHFLRECVQELGRLSNSHEITCLISNAGEEVVNAYGLLEEIEGACKEVVYERNQGYSTPLSGSKRFDAAVVAPATANTVAKVVCGVADSAVSNVVSQFMKRKIMVVFLPTDQEKVVETFLPGGKKSRVYCRTIDLFNVEKLKKLEFVEVAAWPAEIKKILG